MRTTALFHRRSATEIRTRASALLLAGFFVLASTIGGARLDASPISDEFQVNALTTGDQLRPDIAATSQGFTVVWQSPTTPGNDTDGAVVARHIAASGSPVASDFQVNIATTYSQAIPRIGSRSDGSFIVAWRTGFLGGKGLLDAIAARPFDAAGAGAGSQFQVTTSPNIYTSLQSLDVGAAAAGGFVVAFSDFYNNNGAYTGAAAYRRFNAAGAQVGGTNLDGGTEQELKTRIGGDESGFVIAWSRREYFGTYSFTRATRLDGTGAQVGGTLEPDAGTSFGGGLGADGVRLPSGEVQIVWDGYDAFKGPQTEAYGRRVSATGTPDPIGPTLLNTSTARLNDGPRLARASDGTFLVVWEARDPEGDTDLGLRGRWLASDGSPMAQEMAINSQTSGDQRLPEVAASADGKSFLVVWQSQAGGGTDTDGWSIRARFFAPPLFSDGFESGDTSSWSSTIP